MKNRVVLGFVLLLLAASASLAQSTTFTYQGSLQNGGVPANGIYDFQFGLYDALTGGNEVNTPWNVQNVSVVNGQFTVGLNFGPVFTGAPRYLEVRVRTAGAATYTTLAPRNLIATTPYAVRSLSASNAETLNGIAANQYVLTTDSRMTDARNPLAGSSSYIQNSTTQQPSSNFNIGGNGIVNGAFGVGTSSPGFRLNVLDSGNSGFRVQTNTAGGTVASFGGLGAFRVDSPGIAGGRFSIVENGNIGIGATSPTARLSVFGGGFPNNLLVSDSNPTATTFDLANTSVGAKTWRFQSMGSGDANRNGGLELWNVGGPLALAIRPDGNVGIGTSAPAAKLDVIGTIQSSSGGFKFPDGTVQATANVNTVYRTFRDGLFTITPDMTVLQLNLPPGNYVLTFEMTGTNLQSLEARELRCNFSTDPAGVQYVNIEPQRKGAISLSSVATLQSQTIVNTVCRASSYVPTNTSDVVSFAARMTAITVAGNVIIQ